MEFEKIKEIIVDQLGVDESDVNMDSSFTDDLGADSLDLVELIMALEEEFDMEIPDEDAENIKTVADAVNYAKANSLGCPPAESPKSVLPNWQNGWDFFSSISGSAGSK